MSQTLWRGLLTYFATGQLIFGNATPIDQNVAIVIEERQNNFAKMLMSFALFVSGRPISHF